MLRECSKKKEIRWHLAFEWFESFVATAMCECMCAESKKHVVMNLRSRKFRAYIGLLM